jgi:hypothetical protein
VFYEDLTHSAAPLDIKCYYVSKKPSSFSKEIDTIEDVLHINRYEYLTDFDILYHTAVTFTKTWVIPL